MAFWALQPNQEVRVYSQEVLPCYFDLWLLVDTPSRDIVDWRLFQLDQKPTS